LTITTQSSKLKEYFTNTNGTKVSLYRFDHYIPFPSSEYGGLWNVIAEDDDECFDLISAEDDGNFFEKYYSDLKENILNAQNIMLLQKM
jgi:hypothetical protein